jgi:hypothetical protein
LRTFPRPYVDFFFDALVASPHSLFESQVQVTSSIARPDSNDRLSAKNNNRIEHEMLTGIRRAAALAAFLLLVACANADTIAQQPLDSGVTRTFDVPPERLRPAIIESMQILKIQPTTQEEKPEHIVINFVRPPRFTNFAGDVGRVVIERTGAPPTNVRVLYDKRWMEMGGDERFARNLFAKVDQVLAGTHRF